MFLTLQSASVGRKAPAHRDEGGLVLGVTGQPFRGRESPTSGLGYSRTEETAGVGNSSLSWEMAIAGRRQASSQHIPG